MSDLVERLRAGFQCAESGNRCRTMDAQSGCVCAEAADRIEQLESALRWMDEQRYVDRSTINQDNALRKAVSLNERLVKIMGTARAALDVHSIDHKNGL